MLKYGSQGTVCFYFKGLLISSYPLTKKKTLDRYLYHGEHLIYESKGRNILEQINIYMKFCNKIYNKKKNNKKICTEEHIYFLYSLTALLRLKIIYNDECNGYMCFGKKKKKFIC